MESKSLVRTHIGIEKHHDITSCLLNPYIYSARIPVVMCFTNDMHRRELAL